MIKKRFIISLFIFSATSLAAMQQNNLSLDNLKNNVFNALLPNNLTESGQKIFRLNLFAEQVLDAGASSIVTQEYFYQLCNEIHGRESSHWNRKLFVDSAKNNRFALCYLLLKNKWVSPNINSFQTCLKNASVSSLDNVYLLTLLIKEYSDVLGSQDNYFKSLNSALLQNFGLRRALPNTANIVFLLDRGATCDNCSLKYALLRWYRKDRMDLVRLFFNRNRVSFVDVTHFYSNIYQDNNSIEKREVIDLIIKKIESLLYSNKVSLYEAKKVFQFSKNPVIKNILTKYICTLQKLPVVTGNRVIRNNIKMPVVLPRPRGFMRGRVNKTSKNNRNDLIVHFNQSPIFSRQITELSAKDVHSGFDNHLKKLYDELNIS